MLGEASFLRALHYFNLVKTWGCVPIVTTTGSTAPADVQVPRADSEEEVYARIIEDLEFALTACLINVQRKLKPADLPVRERLMLCLQRSMQRKAHPAMWNGIR